MSRRLIAPALYRTLYGQVLIATALGVVVGHFWPATGAAMKPLADGFIKLVRMLIAPIIFCTVVTGIAGVGDMKKVGKVGLTALLFFEVVSTVALVIGMVVANVIQPGAGMNANPATLDARAVASYATQGSSQGVVPFLLAIIPVTVVDAFARGDILQVLLFAVLFGIALHGLHGAGRSIFAFIESLSHALFGVVGMVMKTAPLGAFGAMAYTIGSFGIGSLGQLGALMASFYLTCLVFVFGVLNAIAWYNGFSLWRLIMVMREEIFIVFGTSSSESVLPRIMVKLTDLGVDRSVVGLVIPAGYSFNLTGTAIYLGLATLFVAQATNTPFPLGDQIRLLAILLITSKGAAGVAGAALIVLAGTISATGQIPVAGVALILGIHRFMGEAIAVTNLIGNGMATILVGKWCGQVDERRLARGLEAPARVEEDVAAGRL